MKSNVRSRSRGARRLLVAAAALTLISASLAPQIAAAHPARAAQTLIFWQWVNGADKAVALYNKQHPEVKIIMRNVGAGQVLYTKLQTALKAGTGAPDLAQVEFQQLPQFIGTGGLLDLGKYGANAVKDQFIPWTWSQVSQGSSVYAIPQDTGPMGLYYNAATFAKYHVAVPTTWAEFADAAAKLHAANKNLYILDWDPSTTGGAWLIGLIWQAGGRVFTKSGNSWKVSIDTPISQKVAAYWGDLVNKGLLKVESHWGADLHSDWAKGNVASAITAVWEQNNFSQFAPKQAGQWAVAPLPQWNKGEHAAGNWGGSTTAVTTQSKDPQDAAKFATWLNTNPTAYGLMIKGNGLWPATKQLVDNMDKIQGGNPFYKGNQHVARVFAAAESQVNPNFDWGPQMSFTYAKWADNFAAATKGKMTWSAAMKKTQQQVVGFMNSQGLTVTQ